MHDPHPRDDALSMLIPWDGLTPINQVLTFTRALGGQDARLMLLPVAPELTAATARSVLKPTHPPVQVLDLPEGSEDPAPGIEAVATAQHVDLILMATPCHPAEQLDPSSLAATIALDSPTPVMVVRFDCDDLASFPPSLGRLLVPLDGSLRAAQALPLAANLASRLQVPVRLVMVIDPVQVLPPAYAYDPGAADMLTGIRGEAAWALTQAERLLAHRGVNVSADLRTGPVVRSLEAAVKPGDVLVMATHGIGGAPGSRLGSVAARMVTDVRVPLVILRGSQPVDIVIDAHDERLRYQPLSRPTA